MQMTTAIFCQRVGLVSSGEVPQEDVSGTRVQGRAFPSHGPGDLHFISSIA